VVNLVCEAILPDCPMKDVEEIEKSIMTTYKKSIWAKFLKAISDFDMIQDGDKIAIGVSGGKDSLLLVKLFQELKKDKRKNFEFKAVSLNPGFRNSDLDNFKNNLDKLNIDCEIINTNIWEIANEKAKDYPCFLCAKMRRGILYTQVEELGFNKLTLGHHFDDVIETTLINMLYAGTMKTMTPKVPSTSGKLELIRPLIYVKEADIIDYTKTNGIRAMNCGCTIEAGKTSSKRREVKNLLAELEEKNPGVKQSVFNSMKNINLDMQGDKFYLNNVDVTTKIREKRINENVSKVASIKIVRSNLVDLQRKVSNNKNVILDGRDVGTVIFPNAQVKIFLIASPEERARRRYNEFLEKKTEITYEEVLNSIKERDHIDSTRDESPFVKADDAIELDSTNLTIDDVVNFISKEIEKVK